MRLLPMKTWTVKGQRVVRKPNGRFIIPTMGKDSQKEGKTKTFSYRT